MSMGQAPDHARRLAFTRLAAPSHHRSVSWQRHASVSSPLVAYESAGGGSRDDDPPPDGPSPAAPQGDPLAHLVAPATRGDRQAVDALLRAIAPRVLGVACRILGANSPEAEDVAQEALVAVCAGLPRFRGECSVVFYATRIAVRLALQTGRSNRARTRRELEAEAAEPIASSTPDEAASASKRRAALRALLELLPEDQAEALAMQVVIGMSLQEIADATGAPVNTIRSRIWLAKQATRARIERNPRYRELFR